MAIHQVRLPDKAGTPRVVAAEAPAPTTTPPATGGDAPPAPPAPRPEAPAAPTPATPAADARPWYRGEAWLAVELAAAVPVLLALVAPERLRIPLVALAALLVVLGLAMLAVRERGVR